MRATPTSKEKCKYCGNLYEANRGIWKHYKHCPFKYVSNPTAKEPTMLNGSITAEVTAIDQAIAELMGKVDRLVEAKRLLLQAVDVLKEKDGKAPQIRTRKPARRATEKPLRDDDPVHVETHVPMERADGMKPWGGTPNWPDGVARGTKVDVKCDDNVELSNIIAGAVNWRKVVWWRLAQPAPLAEQAQSTPKAKTTEQVVKEAIQATKPKEIVIKRDGYTYTRKAFGSDMGRTLPKVKFHRDGSKTQVISDAVERKLRQYKRPVLTNELVRLLKEQKSTGLLIWKNTPNERLHAILNKDSRFVNLGKHNGGWALRDRMTA